MLSQEASNSDLARGESQPSFEVSASITSPNPRGSRPPPNGVEDEGSRLARFRASADREIPLPKVALNRRYTVRASEVAPSSAGLMVPAPQRCRPRYEQCGCEVP